MRDGGLLTQHLIEYMLHHFVGYSNAYTQGDYSKSLSR